MKRFLAFTIVSKKGKTSITEVECELISALEDPSVMWLNPGEYRARILKPDSFHQKVEKEVDGKKVFVMVPDVWCWHSFYDTLEQAKEVAAKLIRNEFAFQERKYRIDFTEEDVQKAIAAIDVVKL
jgi:hypothetical protein